MLALWMAFVRLGSTAETRRRPRLRLGSFFFAVLGRGGGFKGSRQALRGRSHFFDGGQKRRLVGFGRLSEPTDLSDKLQRRSTNLIVRNRRIEIEQGSDVSAHLVSLLKLSPRAIIHDRTPGLRSSGGAARNGLISCAQNDRHFLRHPAEVSCYQIGDENPLAG